MRLLRHRLKPLLSSYRYMNEPKLLNSIIVKLENLGRGASIHETKSERQGGAAARSSVLLWSWVPTIWTIRLCPKFFKLYCTQMPEACHLSTRIAFENSKKLCVNVKYP